MKFKIHRSLLMNISLGASNIKSFKVKAKSSSSFIDGKIVPSCWEDFPAVLIIRDFSSYLGSCKNLLWESFSIISNSLFLNQKLVWRLVFHFLFNNWYELSFCLASRGSFVKGIKVKHFFTVFVVAFISKGMISFS